MTSQDKPARVVMGAIVPAKTPTQERAAELTLFTEEKVEVRFDLDLAAVSLVAITLTSTLPALRASFPPGSGSEPGVVPDTIPDDRFDLGN